MKLFCFGLDWRLFCRKTGQAERLKRKKTKGKQNQPPVQNNNNPNTHFTYETTIQLCGFVNACDNNRRTDGGWLDTLRETTKNGNDGKTNKTKKTYKKDKHVTGQWFFYSVYKMNGYLSRQPATGLLFSSFLACSADEQGKRDNVEEGEKGCGLPHRSRNGIQSS